MRPYARMDFGGLPNDVSLSLVSAGAVAGGTVFGVLTRRISALWVLWFKLVLRLGGRQRAIPPWLNADSAWVAGGLIGGLVGAAGLAVIAVVGGASVRVMTLDWVTVVTTPPGPGALIYGLRALKHERTINDIVKRQVTLGAQHGVILGVLAAVALELSFDGDA